jgi:hypothetical protein
MAASEWALVVVVVGVVVAVASGVHWTVLDFVIDRVGSGGGSSPDGAPPDTVAAPPG